MENVKKVNSKKSIPFLPKLWITNKQSESTLSYGDQLNHEIIVNDQMLFYIDLVENKFIQAGDNISHIFYCRFRTCMPYGKNIRKIHNKWWRSYLQDYDLQQSLDLLGIDDTDKKAAFFYLCVFAKFYAWTLVKKTKDNGHTHRDKIESFIRELEKLEQTESSEASGYVNEKNDENTALTLTIKNKKSLIIKDTETLSLIKQGLRNYVDSIPEESEDPINALICSESLFEGRSSNVKSFLCYWFHECIFWVLKKQKKVIGRTGSCDKWLIVSKMIYHIQLIDNKRFLEEKEPQKIIDQHTGKIKTLYFGPEHMKGVITPARKEIKKNPLAGSVASSMCGIAWKKMFYYRIYQEYDQICQEYL